MKLLYTRKQFQGEMEKALASLKQELQKEKNEKSDKEMMLLTRVDELGKQLEGCNDIIKEKDTLINKYEKIIKKLTKENKLYFGAKGGLTKYNNKLQKQLNEKDNELKSLKKELAEANEKLSQRYIVKELEPVKAKNTQVMKTKSGASTSRIIKKVIGKDE